MQAKTSFQEIFFGIIFAITIMTFIKMYTVHQHNLLQKDCVTRTRQLLDYITTGETQQDFLLWPYEEATVDLAKTILDLWGDGAIFDGYTKKQTDSTLAEHIEVTYFPKKGAPDSISVALHQTQLDINWIRNTNYGAWRANLAISKIAVEIDE